MMLRWLYIRLLWMHPAPFRWRFCDQMLNDFDQSARRDRWRLLGDAAISVFRQWVLRPQFHDEAAPADAAVMFHSLEDYRPRGSALLSGSALSVGTFLVVVFALAHSNVGRTFSIGIQRPGLGLLPIDRSAFRESEQSVIVEGTATPENPVDILASFYFKMNPVARALDIDHDLAIAAWEMILARPALLKLDVDHDGQLSPEECGFRAGAIQSAEFLQRARASFMQVHPLVAALDEDHDGVISAAEIRNSTVALQRADPKGDGYFSAREVMPDAAVAQAAFIRLRLDSDGDGQISLAEMSRTEADPVRRILESADRNQDRRITEQEILAELRRRSH
jgi:hypothetical protein